MDVLTTISFKLQILVEAIQAITVGLISIAVAIVISTLIVCYFKYYKKPKV